MNNTKQKYVYLGREYASGKLTHLYKPLQAYVNATTKERSAGEMKCQQDVLHFKVPIYESYRLNKKPSATALDVVGAIYEMQIDEEFSVQGCEFTGETVTKHDDISDMSISDLLDFVNNLKDGDRVYCPVISLRLLDFDAGVAYKRNKHLQSLKRSKNDDMLKLLDPIRESMRFMSTRAKNEIKLKILNYLSGL
tara:strand:- start:1342 stop:1923 length:582 start_codon:yes stop_codon:yes gene_type:complete